MRLLESCAVALLLIGCRSAGETKCLKGPTDEPSRVSACGEACDQGNPDACRMQSKLGRERCFDAHDAETCRWMCLYARSGQDLYCAEHERITGKPVE